MAAATEWGDGAVRDAPALTVPDGPWPADVTLCVMHGHPVTTDDAGYRGSGAWAGQALCGACARWLHRRDTHGESAPWTAGGAE